MVAVCVFCWKDTDTLENPQTTGHVDGCPIKMIQDAGIGEIDRHLIVRRIRKEQIYEDGEWKYK